jgi:hypothetical protein
MVLNSNAAFKIVETKIFFFLMLFPFASPYPIATDVQPLVGGLAFILLLIGWVKRMRIGQAELIGCTLCVISIFYFNPSGSINFNFGKIFALIFGVFTYLYIKKNMEYFSSIIFKRVVYIYFTLSLAFIINPDIFIKVQSFFIRKSNVTELGYRGISTLATEPGLFGGLMVGFLAINFYYYKKGEIKKKWFYGLNLAIIFMIIMTKSGTGYLYMIVFFTVIVMKSHNFKSLILKSLILTIALSYLTYLSKSDLDFDKYGRGMHVFSKVVTDPSLVINDRSVMYRLYAVYVAVISLTESPFGVGHAAVKAVSQEIVDTDSTLNYFYSSYGEDFHAVSSFGFFLTAYGLLFLLPFMYIFFVSKAPLENKVISLTYFLFSYSIAFPIPWFLLLTQHENKNNVKIYRTFKGD